MKKKKILKIVLISILIIILVAIVAFKIYVDDYYKAEEVVNDYLKSNDKVEVSLVDDVYIFDGYGEDNAIVFYQGGKVENIAYAPLLFKLAENGIDCYLVNMPYRLAILSKNKANKVIDKYKYDNWYIMGHSLGGVVAGMYANSNEDKINGLILLAAYPSDKIKNNIKMLSIYGSLDGVLNLNKYNDSKEYWNGNSIEYIIEGGNHANFGYYGKQSSDNESSITKEEQQEITIREIINFINNNKITNSNEVTKSVKAIINEKEYIINLEDNETVKSFVNYLPQELNMSELNGNEKYIYLDTSFPTNSSNPKNISAGDVMLYGDNCLVLFYKSFETSYSYTKIGHIDNLPDLGNDDIIVKFEK